MIDRREYAEPWAPAVGMRVRVRLSAECRVVPHPDSPQGEAGERGHSPWEDGITGVVIFDDVRHLGQGHRFLVAWDESRWYAQGWCNAAAYAAAELVPEGGVSE